MIIYIITRCEQSAQNINNNITQQTHTQWEERDSQQYTNNNIKNKNITKEHITIQREYIIRLWHEK
jgi:hypothetical protein